MSKIETFGDEFPGGGYLADQDEDGGFWNIRDVPFFSELPAGVRSNETAISREWMEAVIERHRELEAQQHLPPVHANHHGEGRENFRIGFLRPTRVGRLVLDGKPRWTLFGDIIRIEDHHFEQIKELKYPYRSAEIGVSWKPEISSLAVSEDEAPHFKLPMLTIGEERRHYDREFLPSQRPAMAFSEVGESAYVCFSFKGAAMAKDKTTDKLTDDGSDGKGGNGGGDDDDKENKLAQNLAKMIKDFEEKIPAMLAAHLDALLPPTVRDDEGERAVEPAMLKAKIEKLLKGKTEVQTASAKEVAASAKDAERFSQMRGEIDALKEKDRLRGETEKSQNLAETKIKELKAEGWHLSEVAVASIEAIAKESANALEHYVKGYKATMPKDPPKTLEEIEVFSADAPEMSKYKTKTPEVLEAARDLSRQYDELRESGGKLTSTREEFIDINLEVLTA